ncbi:MAG: hypothetical protein QXP36_06480 [Conexivisphaerales archaeon]
MISMKQLENALCSKGRLRVLRELSRGEPLSMYMLERKTGIRSRYLKADVQYLIKIGWILRVGDRIVKFQLNYENELVNKTLQFLASIGYMQN